MPLVWIPNLAQTSQEVNRTSYPGAELKLSGDDVHFNPNDNVVRADGNVVGTYAVDTIIADHLEAHLANSDRYFVAIGNISFTDPDGTIKASELRFCWKKGGEIGTGKNVTIKVAGATIKAGSVDIRPGEWVLHDYFITNDQARIPLLSVSGEKITIRPGQEAVMEDSQLNVLGKRLVGFAERTFNLDPRASGIGLPTPEYRPGKGLGYTWTAGSVFEPNTAFELHSDASPGDIPGYGAQITQSFVSQDKNRTPITPRSPLTQRFAYGYMENVLVDKPSDEIATLNQTRSAASFESTINAGVTARGAAGEVFSIPASLTYESGGKLGAGGYMADLHLSAMDQYRQIYISRAELDGSYELPVVKLAPNLFNLARVDTALFQSDTSFGWTRATESLVYQPIKPITLGIAGFAGVDSGRPEYDIDPLTYKNGLALRADYRLGPRTGSYMARYDSRLGWFDQEFKLTQAVGSLEAFVIFRKYPGDTHYGVTLRIDQFQDLITRRNRKPANAVSSLGLP